MKNGPRVCFPIQRNAAISVNVHPPRKKTTVVFVVAPFRWRPGTGTCAMRSVSVHDVPIKKTGSRTSLTHSCSWTLCHIHIHTLPRDLTDGILEPLPPHNRMCAHLCAPQLTISLLRSLLRLRSRRGGEHTSLLRDALHKPAAQRRVSRVSVRHVTIFRALSVSVLICGGGGCGRLSGCILVFNDEAQRLAELGEGELDWRWYGICDVCGKRSWEEQRRRGEVE